MPLQILYKTFRPSYQKNRPTFNTLEYLTKTQTESNSYQNYTVILHFILHPTHQRKQVCIKTCTAVHKFKHDKQRIQQTSNMMVLVAVTYQYNGRTVKRSQISEITHNNYSTEEVMLHYAPFLVTSLQRNQ